MASWIVLDWDQDQFHVLCAQSSRREVKVSRALTWTHPEPFTPSTAERVGKSLRDFLKDSKIAAAPVIVGLGRDRIFLKELRFPPVEAHEEGSLVRFQTAKELAEPIDNYAVDYVHVNGTATERQIMTVAARRDLIGMVQTLCQAAGLKLHAITPRVFGVGHAVAGAVRPDPSPLEAGQLHVVLSIGQRWAELCFFKGDRILQAQALANGNLLVSEVKRNLAVFQAQHAVNIELSGPECLYVFGEGESVIQSLTEGLSLPIRRLDPLKDQPAIAVSMEHPEYFAGGVGLASIWSQGVEKPINLNAPRRISAPVSVNKQRGIYYGAAAAVMAIAFIAAMYYGLHTKRKQLQELTAETRKLEDLLKQVAQERADVEAYKDWEQTTIPWLDELYDMTARHPHEIGFRVNQMSFSQNPVKKGTKDAYPGKVTLTGIMPTGKADFVTRFNQAMAADPHVKSTVDRFAKDASEYHMNIVLKKQAAKNYTTDLIVPPQPKAVKEPVPTPPAVEAELIPLPDEKKAELKAEEQP